MTILSGTIKVIQGSRIVFLQRILRSLGAILIAFGLFGANALDAKEKDGWWQKSSKDKQGAFIGAELGLGETYIGLFSTALSGSGFSPNINLIGVFYG